MKELADDLFWSKVNKTETCWLWTGSLAEHGYGQLFRRRGGQKLRPMVHRVAYEALVGPIPDGLTLDHLCRVRHCLNPDHLEPVSRGENVLRSPIAVTAVNARKTHCKRGHPFDANNTFVVPGGRDCRACRRDRTARSAQRKKAQRLPRPSMTPSAVNSRKTHCHRGHPFDDANTYWWRGHRSCRTCNRANARRVASRRVLTAGGWGW